MSSSANSKGEHLLHGALVRPRRCRVSGSSLRVLVVPCKDGSDACRDVALLLDESWGAPERPTCEAGPSGSHQHSEEGP